MSIEQLNQAHAIDGCLKIVAGKGALPMIEIDNGKACATLSIYAGQVLSFRPASEAEDVLFVSRQAYFQSGKAIKGGVPICWPWFGADPEDRGRPAHGFVRNRMWQLVSTARLDNGATQVVLGMQDSDATRAIWPHAFAMRLEVTVGQSLSMALVTRNTGDSAFTLTQALHTYFSIGNIRQVQVLGLEATEYLDKVDDWQRKTQTGALTVDKEVDRVYLEVRPELVIDDQVFGRRIRIASRGNKTAVLWNPWSKIAAEMADLENDDYLRFVCVETTNAADDVVEVMPGNEFRLEAVYSVEG